MSLTLKWIGEAYGFGLICPGFHQALKPYYQDVLTLETPSIICSRRHLQILTKKSRALQLSKNMLSSTVKRYMRDPVKTYFGLLKIQVKF